MPFPEKGKHMKAGKLFSFLRNKFAIDNTAVDNCIAMNKAIERKRKHQEDMEREDLERKKFRKSRGKIWISENPINKSEK